MYQKSTINFHVFYIYRKQKKEEIYAYIKKQWEKKLEKFREIEFGYNDFLKRNIEVDTIESKVGDLVILNPNYLHEVSKIQGNSDRVTLGMFFGVQSKNRKIFSWA